MLRGNALVPQSCDFILSRIFPCIFKRNTNNSDVDLFVSHLNKLLSLIKFSFISYFLSFFLALYFFYKLLFTIIFLWRRVIQETPSLFVLSLTMQVGKLHLPKMYFLSLGFEPELFFITCAARAPMSLCFYLKPGGDLTKLNYKYIQNHFFHHMYIYLCSFFVYSFYSLCL